MNTAQDIDLKKEVQGIRTAAVKALIFSTACFAAGYLLLPKYMNFPVATFDALVFVLRVDLFILLWVVVAVGLVAHARRQSSADIRAAAIGRPSNSIKIKIAFLQNTLEQAFIAIGSHLVLSTLVAGPALSLIVVATALFAVGRITFYRGYPRGAAARAFGMVTTVIPTMVILGLCLVSLARIGIAP
ncbi:MAG: MAPEG family protein [Polaromonas sp.]